MRIPTLSGNGLLLCEEFPTHITFRLGVIPAGVIFRRSYLRTWDNRIPKASRVRIEHGTNLIGPLDANAEIDVAYLTTLLSRLDHPQVFGEVWSSRVNSRESSSNNV